jgi:preprotein translocase subunit YajC
MVRCRSTFVFVAVLVVALMLVAGLGVVLPGELYAQTGGSEEVPATFGGLLQRYVFMLPLVFAFFYLMVVQPEKLKAKRQQELLSSLTKGDLIVTSGGLVGKMGGTEGDQIIVEVGNGVRLKFEPSAIARRYEPTKGEASGKPKAA